MSANVVFGSSRSSIDMEEAVRALSEMEIGSPLADLLVHCLLATRLPCDSIDFDILSAMTWLLPMVPRYTTSPVQARSLAARRGVRIDVRATTNGWSSVAWMPEAGDEVSPVRVGAASEALSLCASTAALHVRRRPPAALAR
jgi:hypothetical protein